MGLSKLKKLTYIVNTTILIMVLGLMGFFYIIKASFLVYFSIPTALIYVIGYYLIFRERLYDYVRLVYFWISLYMGVTTVCLGYGYGFHLYSMSMIPIIFYSVYMGRSLKNTKSVNAIPASIAIVVIYLVCTLIPVFKGPIYSNDLGVDVIFWIVNSIIVFSFLIFYTNMLIKGISSSEDRYIKLAMEDKLTGLYNRHYMLDRLDELAEKDIDTKNKDTNNKDIKDSSAEDDYYIAMLDIDDFKKINDVYGHNAGDFILKSVAEIMKSTCSDSLVCRWGGEEFLVLGYDKTIAAQQMEGLSEKVSREAFVFEENNISLTVTIGIADRNEADSIDKWIQAADIRLYEGKKSGKNRVVYH